MKNIYLKFYVHFLFLILNFSVYASKDIELTFFDVGQGNCTFIKCLGAPSLLVDIGSSAYRGDTEQERSTFKKNTITKIKGKIQSSLTSFNNKNDKKNMPDLNIIISHGDKDHYNWLKEINLQDLKHFNGTPIKINFLMGGIDNDYNACSDYLKSISKNKFIKIEYIDTLESIPKKLNYGEKLEVDILSALKSKNPHNKDDAEKNQNSIVLKITYGQFSCMLTGDATGETTDRIFFEFRKELEKLKVNICQASHHGANTEGSNQISFFQSSLPQFVIFSAGIYKRYYHPAMRVCERVLSLPESRIKRDVKEHTIQASGENEFAKGEFIEPRKIDDFYTEYKTRCAFYNTTNQGDITFSWNKTDTILEEPKCNKL